MGQIVKNSSVPPSLPKETAESCPKVHGTAPKVLVWFDPPGEQGASSSFCYLGDSKGVPCQALHRAGDGSPSSRASHPGLCVPEALLHFPLVVSKPLFSLHWVLSPAKGQGALCYPWEVQGKPGVAFTAVGFYHPAPCSLAVWGTTHFDSFAYLCKF